MKTTTVTRLTTLMLAISTSVAVLGIAEPASAAPGDNGDIKVHQSTTSTDDERNEPQVCVFYFDAFHFDGLQQLEWTISQHPPTGTAQVNQGSIRLDSDGHGYTTNMELPDGHYEVDWTWQGKDGAPKTKLFTVDCGGAPTPSGSSLSSSTPATPSTSASGSPSGDVSASSGAPSPASAPAPGDHGRSLPITGTPLVWLMTLAGALLAIGILLRTRWDRLVRRRR
ncbi:MAG TPA: hypothetical protein VE172_20475 [Stackebrandtia sp.]|jgi:hypothetical protein|uniref:hypothetical protein n=1 Tax=Stackebrandtia sp. TaxID=2023065 RepID=UPI002D69F543|nr:hypothetical protein [Stackebrandtia sp.]HZE41182.1 hypothetical protein [Stackebrandtia sp.]